MESPLAYRTRSRPLRPGSTLRTDQAAERLLCRGGRAIVTDRLLLVTGLDVRGRGPREERQPPFLGAPVAAMGRGAILSKSWEGSGTHPPSELGGDWHLPLPVSSVSAPATFLFCPPLLVLFRVLGACFFSPWRRGGCGVPFPVAGGSARVFLATGGLARTDP